MSWTFAAQGSLVLPTAPALPVHLLASGAAVELPIVAAVTNNQVLIPAAITPGQIYALEVSHALATPVYLVGPSTTGGPTPVLGQTATVFKTGLGDSSAVSGLKAENANPWLWSATTSGTVFYDVFLWED